MLEYIELTSSNSRQFLELAFPETKSLLLEFPPSLLAIGALFAGRPVGLGMLETTEQSAVLHLKTLKVAVNFRRQGIGKKLMEMMEEHMRPYGFQGISVEYLVTGDQTDSHAFFKSCGFSNPKPGIHIRQGPFNVINNENWLRLSFPPEFDVSSWNTISAEERALLALQVDIEFPEILSPFPEEELIDAERSLIVRHQGKPAGWIILEPLDREMMLIKTLFVYPRYERSGQGVVLIAEVLRRMLNQDTYKYWMFFVEEDNEAMVRLTKRRFDHLKIKKETLWRTHKPLSKMKSNAILKSNAQLKS